MTAPAVLLGGSGFIGAALARRMAAAGAAFTIADVRPSAPFPDRWRHADVRDTDSVRTALAGVETLHLLAAEHGLEPRPRLQFEETNVGGAAAVIAAARTTSLRRIVFTSTVAVYGRPGAPVTEETPCQPENDYGRTKLVAEALLRRWAVEDPSRSLVIVRPTVVFGPGVRGRMRGLFHQLAQPHFRIIGDGTNRKSFAAVDNLAAFLAHAASLPAGIHLFNYADGPDLTMRALARTIRDALSLPPAEPAVPLWRALAEAAVRQAAAAAGHRSHGMTPAQVLRFATSTQYLAPRLAGSGFVAPTPLPEAIAAYARADLRWVAGVTSTAPSARPVDAIAH